MGIALGVFCAAFAAGYLGDYAIARQQESTESDRPDNTELAKLFADDQGDRRPEAGQPIDAKFIIPRDKNREDRIKALYEAGEIRTGKDYYRAAMILQHASKPEDDLLAHEFCIVALAKGDPNARWLAAATEDRFLMKIGRPQRFGTQYHSANNEPVKLYDVGPGVTDGLRKELRVPPLDEALQREAEMGKLFKVQ
ncbi:hypothetical protein [Singulisphaera sp. GP187]|uniref:hypothetical protein n=1 Tax=Singulisphaera sp. GP187 TaxID=1882752 RepID=UPI0011610F33|nr:hypothetical protein [Singulisphaera sp. GP187]